MNQCNVLFLGFDEVKGIIGRVPSINIFCLIKGKPSGEKTPFIGFCLTQPDPYLS